MRYCNILGERLTLPDMKKWSQPSLRFVVLAGSCLLPFAPALAQEASDSVLPQAAAADPHDRPGSEIVVTGVLQRERVDALSGVAVLSGEELAARARTSIGETLARTPGVSATSFGPTASRPILRGLEGERVRVLTDGIGSIDVSNTSADHPTLVNPLLAERIEVLRGPQSLLYGSAAVGGVVNVLDRRIANEVPDEAIHFQALGTYGSAANERSAAASADVRLGDRFVIHADGSYAKTDDLRIGGFVLSPQLRAAALASGDPDIAANAAIRGRLPNSASRTATATLGAAFIDDGGELGVSYTRYDSLYGVPIRFATRPGDEQEEPRIDARQDRIDARAGLNFAGGFLDKARFRYAYGDYRHAELEENGAVGTRFFDKGQEGRLELTQARRGAWSGAFGGQFLIRDFDVIGEEAFLPRNSSTQLAAFTVQQFDLGRVKVEAGARFEHTTVSAKPLPDQPQFARASRKFGTVSGSLGASYDLGGGWRLGANLSRTARTPAAEELFANGPHAGTQAFEIGDPDFKVERVWAAEAILRRSGPGYTIEASAYHNRFDNFIYQDLTGAEQDGLPVFQFRQAPARYYGFEVQGSATLTQIGGMRIVGDALADYIHATIDGVGPAPRIPPLRLLGGLGAESQLVDARVEVEHVTSPSRLSPFETPTRGYTMTNLELTLRPWGEVRPLSLVFSANNVFDVDARRHASVLKDYAPLAGRDFRVTARVEF
ncbi:MAG: TonB-dependent receptor [Novosphingobium sp.]|nr:TonB-dependent receptor [Novosphingobium sp.]